MQPESLSDIPPSPPHGDAPFSMPPIGALSKEAFKEMLAAAERVNRHHMSGGSSPAN
jgi:hypothetical protein